MQKYLRIKGMAMALFLSLLFADVALATTDKYRLTYRDDPSTTIVVGWNQISGTSPVVHYGTTDFGTSWASYPNTKSVDRAISAKGMSNQFARITGLTPNTIYYFVIRDSQGTSARYSFRTLPNVPTERLSIIAGGDSRNNQVPRVAANTLVAKLRPHAVMFGGDMTNGDSNAEWIEWFDDWQNTIGADGRMTPVVATRGNHELNNNSIVDLFDVPSANVYYALTLGGSLLRTYTLNTEISIAGTQTTWLQSDLQSNTNVSWKMAQYHKPMRPHTSSKAEGNDQYNNWANLFQDHGVKVIVECDAHTVKTTWPVVPTTGSGNVQGFVRDDANGSVYVGEGCWGAPLRTNNDDKVWTRASGMFNQFKWIFIDQGSIEIRTIKVDNASSVGSNTDATRFNLPTNLDVWSPSTGSVVTLTNSVANINPVVSITAPADGANFPNPQQITITANASDADGTVTSVDFYQNNVLIGSDATAPYSINWTIPANGAYSIFAVATDDANATTFSTPINISSGTSFTFSKQIDSGSDDVEESQTGTMYDNSTDIELVYDSYNSQNNQVIGLRFNGVTIPQGVTITNAYIQFTCDETSSGSTDLTIRGHASDNSPAFSSSSGNVSSRTPTSAGSNVSWSPAAWNTIGETGAAQRTPNLQAIISEIISRPGWTPGNSMTLVITGTGSRTAESYEGSTAKAAELVIEYTTVVPNVPPTVAITSPANNDTYTTLATINIDATAADADGTINRVEFYQNGSLISTDYTAPYAVSWTFPAYGNFTLMATAFDDDGGSTSSSIAVSVLPPANIPPVAMFTPASSTGNAPHTVYFNASTSADLDGSIVNYSWNFGDGSSGSGITPWHTYYAAGVYTVTLTVLDNNGASATATATVTVYIPNTAPTAVFIPSATSGQAPLAITFNGSYSVDGDGTISNYAWDFGDGTTASGPLATHGIVSHTYTNGGTFTASLVVYDNFNAPSPAYTSTITISSSNIAPTAVIGATPTGGQAPFSVAFNSAGSFDPDGSIVNYNWNFGDGNTATGPTANHTYTTGGSFTATLTVMDNQAATGSASTTINVGSPNVPPTSSFSASTISGYAPLPVSFNAAASQDPDGSIVSYAWDFGDGNSGTGVTANHTYTTSGNFTATLTTTDNNGASTTSTKTINVQTAPIGLPVEVGTLASVNGSWQTVTLTKTYANMVVIATPVYTSNSVDPVVTRIQNASGSSFQIRVQRPNNSSSISNYAVQYIVVEEGTYTVAAHGVKMEARRFTSSSTSYKKNFYAEARSYLNPYSNPVVLGQVMTYNDADWSVFWASKHNDRKAVPASGTNGYNASKHVGEDSDRTRSNETIGVLVIEAGTGNINGLDYAVGYTNDFVQGPNNSSSGYTFGIPITSTNAVLSAAGMDNNDGHWPVFATANGPLGTNLTVWVDEDQLKDVDRSHGTEQIAYLAFGTLASAKTDPADVPATAIQPLSSSLNGYGYPNPTTGMFTLVIQDAPTTEAYIELVDMYGKIVMAMPVELSISGTQELDIANLPSGTYMVRITCGGVTGVTKVSKI